MVRHTLWKHAARVAALAVIVGCTEPISGTRQEQVTNLENRFSFELLGASEFNEPRDYTWRNTGTAATVVQSTILSSGGGELVILDAAGTEVFRAGLLDVGQSTTATGTSGDWTVQIRPVNATGSISFDLTGGI